MIVKVNIYLRAVKYWLQGSSWEDALAWSNYILNGFKKLETKDDARN